MRSRALRILLFLVLGAIVNVAVAFIWFFWLVDIWRRTFVHVPMGLQEFVEQSKFAVTIPRIILIAGALWLLVFAPGWIRRRSRRRRNLCPSCAYPVGSSPVCTECGRPVALAKTDAVV
jgi:hypothetical protein